MVKPFAFQELLARVRALVRRGYRTKNPLLEVQDLRIDLTLQRVWRGDAARRDAGVHCGLGLALVQRLMTALGGSVTAELQAGGVFVVRINLGHRATEHR